MAIGRRKVESTSRLGDETNLTWEKKASSKATQDPAPKTAASKEAQIMSFSRIEFLPSNVQYFGYIGHEKRLRITQYLIESDANQKRAALFVTEGRAQGFRH